MHKPELLVPVGTTENFYAALKGGADAIYMGLKQFNARERAANFSFAQLPSLVDEAKKENVLVYITLNTVIKNHEIPALLDTLFLLSKSKVAAIIIQDWGVYQLAKKHFPNLVVHASTQMANHNSLGAKFSKLLKFERVIMARELSMPELEGIMKDSPIEVECFIHGALCYSFSGMCQFSSYLGGSGANRGLCTQPCRRLFEDKGKKNFTFNLKDNWQIDSIPQLMKLGVASLKIEGRLKSADYVYRVTSAYRKAIDFPDKIEEAKALLQMDLGREKTSYFLGGKVTDAISDSPNTGLRIGKVRKVTKDEIILESNTSIQVGYRLRFRSSKTDKQTSYKVKACQQNKQSVSLPFKEGISAGDQVYLAGMLEEKFPNKLPELKAPLKGQLPFGKKKQIQDNLFNKEPKQKAQLYFRVDSLAWLRKLRLEDIDQLILNFTHREWEDFKPEVPFLKKNQHKIWIELPGFIPENRIHFYKELANKLYKSGYKQFFLSHLSQKLLLPKGVTFACNQNVYTYNDAAIQLLKKEGAQHYTYPLENDKDNLCLGKYRNGIVPIYFYPALFNSRMPVEISSEENQITDDLGNDYKRVVRNGITHIVPVHPVSLIQYTKELKSKGFSQFLIDLNFDSPSKNIVKTLQKRYRNSEQVQPSTNFNFKKGLK